MSDFLECVHCKTDDIKYGATVCKGCGTEIIYYDDNLELRIIGSVIIFIITAAIFRHIIGTSGGIIGAVIGIGLYIYLFRGPLPRKEKIKWKRRLNASRK